MRLVTLFAVVVAMLLVSLRAEAGGVALPIDHGFAAIVAGDAPSSRHPKGTLLVFHVGASHEAAAFEWDIALARAVSRKRLGSLPEPASMVRTVRADSRIFVVFGATNEEAPVVLMRVTPGLAVEAREEIGQGTMPSIDADAASGTVVTAFFEERPPTSGPTGRTIVLAPPTKILNAQTRESATFRRLATSHFAGAGGTLLSPHGMPGRAARAVAIHDGRAVLALPLPEATRVVTVRLPQLVIDGERELPCKNEPFGSMALVHAGTGVVAVGDARSIAVAGQPSLSARVERAVADSDDVVIAWQAVHRLTRDLDGKTVLETSPFAPEVRASSSTVPRLVESR